MGPDVSSSALVVESTPVLLPAQQTSIASTIGGVSDCAT
jgi:hypothetical protein